MQILLATSNQGKVIELKNMLAGKGIEVLSLRNFPEYGEIEETGRTFAENAMIKARQACALTGIVSLADDSGLEVDVLNCEPGVYSARYAGEPKNDANNIDKLLAKLEEMKDEARTARFCCCLAIVCPDGREFLTEGSVDGTILRQRRGSGGFGYDPVFFLPELQKTMAELSLEEKNSFSHRAQALRKAVPMIEAISGQRIGS